MCRAVIRPVAERAIRTEDERLLERAEMRMIRWIEGVSMREQITNEEIKRRAGVACISDKVRETMRWFGHVARMQEVEPMKKAWKEPVKGKRSVGRPEASWVGGQGWHVPP